MNNRSEPKYIGEHFQNDFERMVEMLASNPEDLCLNLHELLNDLTKRDTHGNGNWRKLNLTQRGAWEKLMHETFLKSVFKEDDQKKTGYKYNCERLLKEWGGNAGEDGIFVGILKEVANVRTFTKDVRLKKMPLQWAFRDKVTLDALLRRVERLDNHTRVCPVLGHVLQSHVLSILDALGCLGGMFEWQQLVHRKYSGRITREEAAKLTPRKVMDDLPKAEAEQWRTAFEKFEQAWRIAFKHVERYQCHEFKKFERDDVVNEDYPLTYCIADELNEGIYAMALNEWLIERHNELAGLALFAMRTTGEQLQTRRTFSSVIAQCDLIAFSEIELEEFVKSQCVAYVDGGNLDFDHQKAENYVRQEMARPQITLVKRVFEWLGEGLSQGRAEKILNQNDLTPEICDRIRGEIKTPLVANFCLQEVLQVISFLRKHVGEGRSEEELGNMGDQLLTKYFKENLCVDNVEKALPSATARDQVHLRHLDAFNTLLKTIINVDIADKVEQRYKVEIPDKLANALLARKGEYPAQLVGLLGKVAEEQMGQDGGLGSGRPFLEILDFVWNDAELDAESLKEVKRIIEKCEDEAKEELKVMHWFSVYRLIKSMES